MPRVSIIIPAYCDTSQKVDWLLECIASVVKQDAEIIVCDDGSPVDMTVVSLQFGNRIRHYRTEHVGVSHARNEAVKLATCELILPLDCDDKLHPTTISKLLSVWDGHTPVYPDVAKFGAENVPHYALLDFHCDHILKHVGFSSVNVLHSKKQWEAIGGWNEELDFFEDGEYNARLFSKYCGKRFPEPLVMYRIHDSQRTVKYRKQSAYYANKIMQMIRRLEMPCKSCGGGRKIFDASVPATVVPANSVDVASLPGELNGRILAQYIGGKGRGKHYYRGPATKFPYKVVYGDYVYVDAADARSKSDTMNPSLLVLVEKSAAPVFSPKPAAPQAPQRPEEVTSSAIDTNIREARKDIQERVSVPSEESAFELPDIHNMSVREVLNMDAIPVAAIEQLLAIEQNGKNRSKVVAHLQGILNG